MAVAFGSGVVTGNAVAATSLTQSLTTSGSDRAVFAFYRESSGAGPPATNVTSIAYNGTNLTRIQDRVGAGNRHGSSFGSTNFEPTSGANNMVWTFVGATSNACSQVAVSGVDQTTRYTASAFSGADSGSSISTAITVASGGMAVDWVWSGQLVSLTAGGSQTAVGANFTELTNGTSNSSYLANATTMAWTAGASAQYVHLVIAVNPVSAGGGVFIPIIGRGPGLALVGRSGLVG